MADPADPAPDDLAPDDLAEAILGEPRYTVGELMASTGTDRALADELWLSLGFPLTRDEETASFTEADAEALRSLGTLLELGFIDRDQLMAMTRVMGQTLSRLASTQVQLFHDELAALVAPAPGDADPLDAEVRAATTELLVPGVERFVSYCWRRHLFAALDRDLHAGSGRVIGFVDLVEFTRTTRDLGPDELATLVGRFERYVYDEVTGSGAHLRKLLGDGVMFDAPDVATAAGAALALVLRCAEDPHLRGAAGWRPAPRWQWRETSTARRSTGRAGSPTWRARTRCWPTARWPVCCRADRGSRCGRSAVNRSKASVGSTWWSCGPRSAEPSGAARLLRARAAAAPATDGVDLAGGPDDLVPARVATFMGRVRGHVFGHGLEEAREADALLLGNRVPHVVALDREVGVDGASLFWHGADRR